MFSADLTLYTGFFSPVCGFDGDFMLFLSTRTSYCLVQY